MEQLIHELYDPANQGSSATIQSLQHQIQRLQREKAAWQLGLDFLASNEANVRFYGASTLLVKINADWIQDGLAEDSSMRHVLLEGLVSHYVRLTGLGDASFVLQKLCSTLAALFMRTSDIWLYPVRHVFASLVKQTYADPHETVSIDQLIPIVVVGKATEISAAVRFAATLAEDIAERTGRTEALIQLSANCQDVFKLIRFGLEVSGVLQTQPKLVDETGTAHLLDLAQMSIQATIPWQTLLSDFSTKASAVDMHDLAGVVSQVLIQIFGWFGDEEMRPYVLQTLTAVQQSSPKLLTRADNTFPLALMRSQAARDIITSLKEGNFDQEETLFVEFLEAIMAQVDLTTSRYLRSGRLADVFPTLQLLLRCRGVAAVEDTACPVVLEIMNQVVDGHTDWTDDDRDDDDTDFKVFVQQACEACFAKVVMPLSEMSTSTRTWDADERSRFSSFRYDVQDFLSAAYMSLGSSLPAALTTNLSVLEGPPNWPLYEATIFCLKGFADAMPEDAVTFAPYFGSVFGSAYFQAVLTSNDVPDQARKTSIQFISDTTTFLKTHPDLMPVLNFLFSSLHLASSSGAASQAIYTLCYEQRSSLTETLPNFLASLSTIEQVEGVDRHRIFGGVATIVQALPGESAKLYPIMHMLELLTSMASGLSSHKEREKLISQATDLLHSLAAIGRGLRIPNDVPSLTQTASSEASFWTTGPGSMMQSKLLNLYDSIMASTSETHDSGLIEAAADFIRSGLTEDHPSPFKFTVTVYTTLISDQITLESGNIDAVLSSASSLLASVSKDEMRPYMTTLLSPVLRIVQKLLADHTHSSSLGDTNFPSATLDFVARLLPKWIDMLLSMAEGEHATTLIIDLALVVLANPDTLPRRSAASFVSALVDVSKPQKTLTATSREIFDAIIQQQNPRIIALILRLVAGECARSELEVLSDPIRKYAQYQLMAFKSIGKGVMKMENAVLSKEAYQYTALEQRNRFIAQVEALRGARKTNEVVKEFWIACRGSNFSYIS